MKRRQLAMKPTSIKLKQALVLLVALTSTAISAEQCRGEPRCTCKWSVGRSTADCSNQGLTAVPNTLKKEIQAIVLDGNPLESLEKDVFKAAGLMNLQLISLRSCQLTSVHEDAFRDLRILKEVDISNNNLTKLRPKTFDGDDNLQIIKLSQNPIRQLVAHQFPPLKNLKKLDFSQCELQSVDRKAFQNLIHGVESIFLNNNRLRTVFVESFIPLQETLKTLHLHENPWDCDCKLQSFREFVMAKNLFNRPTSCMEPARLHGKMWDEIDKRDFACKPHIEVPYEFVFGSPGRNATLSCHVTGSPSPTTRWVVDGRIVNNNTSPVPFSDQKWMLTEEVYGIQKWFNLTVTNAGYDNLGVYLCVAENTGGVMEKSVTLTFDDPDSISHRDWGLTSDQWTVVIGAITASLVFLALLIALICFCCVCKRSAKAKQKHHRSNENGSKHIYGNEHDQSHQRLLPPQTGQTPIIEPQGSVICAHYSDHVRAPSVISKPQSLSNTDSSRASIVDSNYDPDLIHHYNIKKTSTPLSASTLMTSNGNGHHGGGGHPRGVSPFTRSGTLPIHYHHHHHHPRSVSCDHSSQTLRLTPQPPKQQKHSLQMQQRPGYVTLPRRPRSSWSAPPRDSPTPSMYAMTMRRTRADPIYDGVGPRTSADGSSLGTLPRSGGIVKTSLCSPAGQSVASSGGKVSLGPYYAPIAEIQECPSTPKEDKKNRHVENASSEMTLMEESISSYCEPFGKALVPTTTTTNGGGTPPTATGTPTPLSSSTGSKSRHSTTSAESELEALIQNGNPKNGHRSSEDSTALLPPMMPLLPPIMTSTQGIAETSFNEPCEKKVPPKTLPKPKVRPLPPPKPSKSAMINRPVTFQDEGADGSEV